MAYEKALSLITGGGKTFEIEGDGLDFTVKATPEEMEVGALAVKATEIEEKAYICTSKGRDLFTQKSIAIFISNSGDNEIRTFKCKYDETKGGYVYGNIGGDDQPVG